ncbi:MAG: tail fiber protein [Bacteroidota bacterium]
MEGMIGEIRMFGGNFAPRSWALCEGQLLAISSNQALFSILGTTYGGDGRTTFALPDLRGRSPIQHGTGPGLSTYRLGQRGGVETVTLNSTQIPAHNHTVALSGNPKLHLGAGLADSDLGNGNAIAASTSGDTIFTDQAPNAGAKLSDTSISLEGVTTAVGLTGGNLSHENRSPYLAVNFIICLQGVFPSRN